MTIALSASIVFSQTQPTVQGTRWVCKISKNTYDTLSIGKSDKYVHYSSELNDKLYGEYKVNGDTLLLYQERGKNSKQAPGGHIRGKGLFKYIIARHTLKLVYSQPNMHLPPEAITPGGIVWRKIK